MKKSIFDKQVAEEILARAAALQATHPPKWGSMQVTDMLRHCNTVNQLNPGEKPSGQKPEFKRLLKVLFPKMQFLKSSRLPEANNHKDMPATQSFEAEKIRFFETIQGFSHHTGGRQAASISREWGVITWMHTDHHLRQFGV